MKKKEKLKEMFFGYPLIGLYLPCFAVGAAIGLLLTPLVVGIEDGYKTGKDIIQRFWMNLFK